MERLLSPAALARCAPFVLFMVLLALRGALPENDVNFEVPGWAPQFVSNLIESCEQIVNAIDPRWVYGVSVLVVGASLAYFWRQYKELSQPPALTWREALMAVVVGLVVWALWKELTYPWMMLGEPTAGFRPVDAEGRLQWGLIVVRWIGAALLVPVMEELFWRSFLMRWIDKPDFETVDPRTVTLKAVVLSTAVFTLAHTQWLAAILAGLAYAWLYRATGKLWAPILAHAVTNGVLGVWVVLLGNWEFW